MTIKIGVLGLGEIAQRIYLPIYGTMQDKYEFILCSTSEEKSKALCEKHGFSQNVLSIEGLIENQVTAVFVHAATNVHYPLCKKLLNAGIHVFVDKPVSENIQEIETLMAIAEENQLIFMVGVNRRFMPLIENMKEDFTILKLTKNLPCHAQPMTFALYDLFIHILDLGIYLLKEPILNVQPFFQVKDEKLQNTTWVIETKNQREIISMNLASGANRECYELESLEKTLQIVNLTEFVAFENGKQIKTQLPQRSSIEWQRGFVPMVQTFLDAVTTGDRSNLRQENVLLSHQLIDEMIHSQKNK